MPRSGGTYSLPANTLAVSGNTISSTYFNNFANDVASELTASVPRDGSAAMTARLTSTGLNKGAYANLASGSTTDLASTSTGNVTITGTTTITSFGSGTAGIEIDIVFAAALTLTHNGTSLILPTGANITTAAGDCCRAISLGSGNWRVVNYIRASGLALATTAVTYTLATVSGSVTANLDFTSSVPSGVVRFMLSNITIGTAGSDLQMQVSTNAGSSWVATGYQHERIQAVTSSPSSSSATGSASDTLITLANSLATTAALSGTITANIAAGLLDWQLTYYANGGSLVTVSGGANMPGGTINGFRFKLSSGNFAATGNIKMYDGLPA